MWYKTQLGALVNLDRVDRIDIVEQAAWDHLGTGDEPLPPREGDAPAKGSEKCWQVVATVGIKGIVLSNFFTRGDAVAACKRLAEQLDAATYRYR